LSLTVTVDVVSTRPRILLVALAILRGSAAEASAPASIGGIVVRMFRLWVVIALVGCAHSDAVPCERGTDHDRTCPAGNACDDIHHLCVEPSQLTSCIGMPDRAECMAGTEAGFCDGEICLPLRCGDGVAIGGEPCDGNDFRGETCLDHGFYTDTPLTCSASCEITTEQCVATCGDDIIEPAHELCDGQDPASVSCSDFGYGAGSLSCLRCGPGFEACKYFGWHTPVFTSNLMSDIDATSDTNVWAVGISAQVKHFDGADWRTFDLSVCSVSPSAALFGVDVVGDDDVWIAGRDGSSHGLVIHIVGASCTTYVQSTTGTFTDIAVSGPNDVWLARNGVTHFDGQAFTQSDATSATRVWAVGATDVYAAAASSSSTTLRHWDGTSWTTVPVNGSPGIYTATGTAANDLYIGGIQGSDAILLHWDGATWTTLFEGVISGQITSIQRVGTRLFVGTSSPAAVYEYDGAGWARLDSPSMTGTAIVTATPTSHLYGIATNESQLFRYDGNSVADEMQPVGVVTHAIALRQDQVFATLASGELHLWNGATWTNDSGASGVSDVATDGAGSIYTIGSAGLLTRTLASPTWTTLDGTASGARLWVVAPDDIWVLDSRKLLHFNGTTTDIVPCATCTATSSVNDLWGTGNDIFAVGNDDNVMHWNGSSWTTTTVAPQLEAVYGWAPNDVVAVASTGALYHYDGTSWTILSDSGQPVAALWGTSSSDIFVGSDQGAVAHYDGARWSPVDLANQGISVITGAGDSVFFFDITTSSSHRLVRTTPW
jgi:hypothetical protein